MDKHTFAHRIASVFVMLILSIVLNVLVLIKTCALQSHCWQSLVGHWYPSLFILFVAYHTDNTSVNSAMQLSNGMIAFGAFYIFMDVLQKGWNVSTYSVKSIQHNVVMLMICVLGVTRAIRNHTKAMFYGELDKLLFFVLAVLLVVFMANHPQPTHTGDCMHALTAFYVVLWYVFGVANWQQRAQWAMCFAAACFVASQQGLCTLAYNNNVDTVATACIVHLIGYIMLLCFTVVDAD